MVPSFQKMIYAREAGIDWRDLVKGQLEQIGQDDGSRIVTDNSDFERAALQQAIQSHPDSVRDQQDAWCRATGKSRASFFRWKKSLDEKSKDQQPPTEPPPSIHPENN